MKTGNESNSVVWNSLKGRMNIQKDVLFIIIFMKKYLFMLFIFICYLFIYLLMSNHTAFLVQFGINFHLWVYQKAKIALAEAAHAMLAFWKIHLGKLIPNWTCKRRTTYTNQA